MSRCRLQKGPRSWGLTFCAPFDDGTDTPLLEKRLPSPSLLPAAIALSRLTSACAQELFPLFGSDHFRHCVTPSSICPRIFVPSAPLAVLVRARFWRSRHFVRISAMKQLSSRVSQTP